MMADASVLPSGRNAQNPKDVKEKLPVAQDPEVPLRM
jgi:hypothetical protein